MSRQLVLKRIEGEQPKDSRGMTDKRLFTGENEVQAVFEGNLWRLRYTIGDIPAALKQQFTSFKKLMDFLEPYFKNRGILIEEVR